MILSRCFYCTANVTQRSQKPHVFVKPRGALRPVQRPGEIRGAGGAGVSSGVCLDQTTSALETLNLKAC